MLGSVDKAFGSQPEGGVLGGAANMFDSQEERPTQDPDGLVSEATDE